MSSWLLIEDWELGYDRDDPPRPGSLDETYEFVTYAESFEG